MPLKIARLNLRYDDKSKSSYRSGILPSDRRYINLIPEHNRTPGAINPDVTQEKLRQAVCVVGYTKDLRGEIVDAYQG